MLRVTLWALLGVAAVMVEQARSQMHKRLNGEEYCEQQIDGDRERCEASSDCCSWNEGDGECVSHIGDDECPLPEATVEAYRLNGEQYCEQLIDEGDRDRCDASDVCCSWNEGDGKCWSDIGRADCPLDDALVDEEWHDEEWHDECDEECEEAAAAIMGILVVLACISIAACVGILVGINCCINNKKQQYPGARVRGGAWIGCVLLFVFDLWCFMWIPFCVSHSRAPVPAQWHHSERHKRKSTTAVHPSV